ncbi:hypothetical protein [Blastopirellula marina]|uniref:Uncharacterized protein n=1 Tax=Blastopirellula marina TaxID=124 RepID=A0A2S8GPN8_9BACT|nr:hypothetical protein [Blastopirellula marina]PQO46382.1 hypothetical protein C5Y93_10395 [Blastopirellula marina]
MSDPQPNESPFQSPVGSDIDSARAFLGSKYYALCTVLPWAFIALALQLATNFAIPTVNGMADNVLADLVGLDHYVGLLVGAIGMASLIAMGVTFRLTQALGWHWAAIVAVSVLVGVPFIGPLMLMYLSTHARETLKGAGIPLQLFSADWPRIRQIAVEQETPTNINPFSLPYMNQLYHLVFCDDPQLASIVPASITKSGWLEPQAQLSDPADLRAVVERETVDSRVRLLAAAQLRSGKEEAGNDLGLGIVFESKPEDEHYLVAMYADGGMACLHGKSNVHLLSPGTEGLSAEVRTLVAEVMEQRHLFAEFPDNDRRPPPPLGEARITLLTTMGPRVGQSTWKAFHKLPVTKPLAEAAISMVDRLHGFEPAPKHQLDATDIIPTDMQQIARHQRQAIAAMVIYGLSFPVLICFGDAAVVGPFGLGIIVALFLGSSAFAGYAAYRLLKLLGRPKAGLVYGLLSIFPGVPLVSLGFAYYWASQYLKAMELIGR